MNRSDLVKQIAKEADITAKQAEASLKATIEGVSGALKKGDKVSFVGFGSFSVKKRAAREGRNRRTGEKLKIPAMKVPKFSAGKGLKDAVK